MLWVWSALNFGPECAYKQSSNLVELIQVLLNKYNACKRREEEDKWRIQGVVFSLLIKTNGSTCTEGIHLNIYTIKIKIIEQGLHAKLETIDKVYMQKTLLYEYSWFFIAIDLGSLCLLELILLLGFSTTWPVLLSL